MGTCVGEKDGFEVMVGAMDGFRDGAFDTDGAKVGAELGIQLTLNSSSSLI